LACLVFGSAETDMPDPKSETEVERLKAKALARWESEGGALAASKSDQVLAASPGAQTWIVSRAATMRQGLSED
jgi:hypothetical protein